VEPPNIVENVTQPLELTSQNTNENLQMKSTTNDDSEVEKIKIEITKINPDVANTLCAKTNNLGFFKPNEKFTPINGQNCYGGIYVRQAQTIIMASSVLQLKGSSDKFYCAFICTSHNKQITIAGTFDFENITKVKLSDYVKTIGLLSNEDELKMEQMLKENSKPVIPSNKKPINRKRKKDAQNDDSDAENPYNSQDSTNSPTSSPPKSKRAKTTKNSSNIKTSKTTVSKASTSPKVPTNTKASITPSTPRLTRSKVQAISDSKIETVTNLPPPITSTDMNYDKLMGSIKDMIKKELFDFKQTMPNTNSTPLLPQAPIQATTPIQTPIPNGYTPASNTYAPNSFVPNTYTPPNSYTPSSTAPNAYPPPQNAYIQPHTSSHYHQHTNYPYSTPYSQVPNQVQIQAPSSVDTLSEEIFMHLEQARNHFDIANRLLNKKAR